MKFRYKVLIINIILLSIGIGTVGYFMIDKNMSLALDAQIKNAIDENNMIQSAVEYQLLGVAGQSYVTINNTLKNASSNVIVGISANESDIYIIYNNSIVYTNSSTTSDYPAQLATNSILGEKQYIITDENNQHYIYSCSCSIISGAKLNIINKRNITETYNLMNNQLTYFRLVLILVVLACSIFMFIISILLTKPLERLKNVSDQFGKGDYSARAAVTTLDEVGELSNTYNQMAEAVEEHVEELQAMVERQDRFVADFTHEIKTPMTTIIGYADTIRSKELSRENQIMAASYIFSEGKRLETMSMKLFDLLYTKQQKLNIVPFSTKRLGDEIAESVSPSLEYKEIKFLVSVENATINGDIDLLKSSFINLIDNARKASAPGKEIHFLGSIKDNNYIFKVRDFGVGIPAEHLSKITDAFYMVDKSRSRKEGGAGLGLSLASLVFSSHNAKLDIESTPNVGTTFSITFSLNTEGSDEIEKTN